MTLSDALRGALRPMEPVPAGFQPRPTPIEGIRAAVFDIYGTLLISETGDIAAGDSAGLTAPTPELSALMAEFGVSAGPPELSAAFAAAVRSEHLRMSSSEAFPEIVAERLWAEILGVGEPAAVLFAAAWEASVNKVWEMPGAAETLRSLRTSGFLLGIVSNAQSYTPPLFPLVLGDTVEGFGFEPDLVFYSYREGRGKPSPRLFADLSAALARRGIAPGETVFVGNDMLKDMMPARDAGLRTCLFAGDERSLKLRTGDPRCAFPPDAAIDSLARLPSVLAGGSG